MDERVWVDDPDKVADTEAEPDGLDDPEEDGVPEAVGDAEAVLVCVAE